MPVPSTEAGNASHIPSLCNIGAAALACLAVAPRRRVGTDPWAVRSEGCCRIAAGPALPPYLKRLIKAGHGSHRFRRQHDAEEADAAELVHDELDLGLLDVDEAVVLVQVDRAD